MGVSKEPVEIKRTARDKGYEIQITVTAYDNGQVNVDGIPQDSWAGATVAVSERVYRLWREADKRQRAETGETS